MRHDDFGQRFETVLTGYLRSCAPARFKRQIDVFQKIRVVALNYALLELVGEFALCLDGVENIMLAV